MKSLSKKNVKKNTKKRLGKSKKHNKSKKTHKKSRKQQKGGFVINEYEGIQNIPATATKDIQNAKSYEEYRETCNYDNQDKNQVKLKELRKSTLDTTIARLHKLIKKEHEYMTQPIKKSDHKYLHLVKGDYIDKNVNFKYFPGNLKTIVELDNQFKRGDWENYKIILSNIYCINKVFDGTEFDKDETNTYFYIKITKDYKLYRKEHDDLVTELFGDILADDSNNLNTKSKFVQEKVTEEFKEEDKEPKKSSFLPSINIFSR
jgi:hypothetical protein